MGVSCVAGNVGLDDVVRNTLAVLELAGRDDVEVAAGRDRPLARPLRTASDTHGPSGIGLCRPATTTPRPEHPRRRHDAVWRLRASGLAR